MIDGDMELFHLRVQGKKAMAIGTELRGSTNCSITNDSTVIILHEQHYTLSKIRKFLKLS